jgi:hypothetical protein
VGSIGEGGDNGSDRLDISLLSWMLDTNIIIEKSNRLYSHYPININSDLCNPIKRGYSVIFTTEYTSNLRLKMYRNFISKIFNKKVIQHFIIMQKRIW